MVLIQLRELLSDRFGCEAEAVELGTSLDELNLYPADREEIAAWFLELYGVGVSAEEIAAWETIEDIVGHIEDHME